MIIDTITHWSWSFVANHWLLLLAGSIVLGGVIRIYLFATNPIQAVVSTVRFFREYWREAIVVVLITGALAFVLRQHLTIKDQAQAIKEKEEQLAIAHTNIQNLMNNTTKLENALKDANKMVERFDRFSSETKFKFNQLNQNVSSNNQSLTNQIQDILREKKPQTCEEAIQYLIDANREYVQ